MTAHPLTKALGDISKLKLPKDRNREAERERWLQRYIGLFGEPSDLAEYRAGNVRFRDLHDNAMRTAHLMLAEAGYIQSDAFNDED